MNVTIKDIAKKLNLNHSSVSRALNNKPGVSAETRQLVLKTAKKMGYHPNDLARGLVSRVTKTIGIIIPEIVNPLFGEITTGITETANEFDYDIFLCITNWDLKKEKEYLRAFKEKRVDGIIIKSANDSPGNQTSQLNIPIVGFENWTIEQKISSVSTDNFKGGYLAANHLLECGYKKTAFLSGPECSSARQGRLEGFLKAYGEHDLPFDYNHIYTGDYNIDSGYESAKKILSEFVDIDSIFAGNDVMAFGVLMFLEENGIIPGEDVGVVGFDDIKFTALPQIRLTTIRQPKYNIGRIITKLLLEEISNTKKGIKNLPQNILLEPELIPRKTTCRRDRP